MKTEMLQAIEPLLVLLRSNAALVEVKPQVFHHNGQDFVHFHESPQGIVADVRLARGQVRLSATSAVDQAELLDLIEQALLALDQRSQQRRKVRRRGRASEA
jgi:hypothetical protein